MIDSAFQLSLFNGDTTECWFVEKYFDLKWDFCDEVFVLWKWSFWGWLELSFIVATLSGVTRSPSRFILVKKLVAMSLLTVAFEYSSTCSYPSTPRQVLPNWNSKIKSTYCVLKVNAALVILDGKWSPLMISCHSFLLITSTSPPRAITKLYSSYKSNTDLAMMGRRLIGVPAKNKTHFIDYLLVHASEIHRFYASCCVAVNWNRRYCFSHEGDVKSLLLHD